MGILFRGVVIPFNQLFEIRWIRMSDQGFRGYSFYVRIFVLQPF
jgi:hypothetical protein